MKIAYQFAIVVLFLFVASCSPSAQDSQTDVQGEPENTAAEPAAATATEPSAPAATATSDRLQLEVVNSIVWADKYGQVRASVMVRNPYEFPVEFTAVGVNLLNGAGDMVKSEGLYFLDGVSGGTGFIMPGETVAAQACFSPCDGPPSTLEWDSQGFTLVIREATNSWKISTEVEATVSSIDIDGDSPLFWVYGTVTNNSDELLQRISARVFVYDQDGNFVGAAEVSSWDVPAGATVDFNGYGTGSVTGLSVDYEVTALGVNY